MRTTFERVCQEVLLDVPISLTNSAPGVMAAYLVSKNILASLGAGIAASAGIVTYFCASEVSYHTQMNILTGVIASVATAYLFGVSAEIFMLTGVISIISLRIMVLSATDGMGVI